MIVGIQVPESQRCESLYGCPPDIGGLITVPVVAMYHLLGGVLVVAGLSMLGAGMYGLSQERAQSSAAQPPVTMPPTMAPPAMTPPAMTPVITPPAGATTTAPRTLSMR
jgi:hypothetical protein